jgi:hypothetical protein
VAVPDVSVPCKAVMVAPTNAVTPSDCVIFPETVPGKPSETFIVVGVPAPTLLPAKIVVP